MVCWHTAARGFQKPHLVFFLGAMVQYSRLSVCGDFIENNYWNKEIECRSLGFDPWVGKIPWRKKWQPASVFLPGESHGQRSLVGYGPWGHKSQTWPSSYQGDRLPASRLSPSCAEFWFWKGCFSSCGHSSRQMAPLSWQLKVRYQWPLFCLSPPPGSRSEVPCAAAGLRRSPHPLLVF